MRLKNILRKKSGNASLSGLPHQFESGKYIFIHIPKCAGSSFFINNMGYQGGHDSYRYYEKVLGDRIYEFFIFSVVRNPVSRFVSALNFLKAGGMSGADREAQRLLQDIDNPNRVLEMLKDGKNISLHFRPQVEFLKNSRSRIAVDNIVKMEDIEEILENRSLDFSNEAAKQAFYKGFEKDAMKNQASAGDRKKPENLDLNLLFDVYQEDFWRFDYEPD
jgi:hypothetical protein